MVIALRTQEPGPLRHGVKWEGTGITDAVRGPNPAWKQGLMLSPYVVRLIIHQTTGKPGNDIIIKLGREHEDWRPPVYNELFAWVKRYAQKVEHIE